MKKRIVFALIMGMITTTLVSLILIAVNVGFVHEFWTIWLRSWCLSYFLVVFAMLFIAPKVQSLVDTLFHKSFVIHRNQELSSRSLAIQIHNNPKQPAMAQTTANKAQVTVIGMGKIGSALSRNLVRSKRPVLLADRTLEKAQKLSAELGHLAKPMDISAAIKAADIVVLALWLDAIKELIDKYAPELHGKIIVDPSNPVAVDEQGSFKKIIGGKESSGELLSAVLPKDARLVKALGTLGVVSLARAAFLKPERAVLFYAGDDRGIDAVIEELIRDAGFEPVRVGDLHQSIRLEVFGDLHEFGALGRIITRAEAKRLVQPP